LPSATQKQQASPGNRLSARHQCSSTVPLSVRRLWRRTFSTFNPNRVFILLRQPCYCCTIAQQRLHALKLFAVAHSSPHRWRRAPPHAISTILLCLGHVSLLDKDRAEVVRRNARPWPVSRRHIRRAPACPVADLTHAWGVTPTQRARRLGLPRWSVIAVFQCPMPAYMAE